MTRALANTKFHFVSSQKVFCGLGQCLINETLHLAIIHPLTPACYIFGRGTDPAPRIRIVEAVQVSRRGIKEETNIHSPARSQPQCVVTETGGLVYRQRLSTECLSHFLLCIGIHCQAQHHQVHCTKHTGVSEAWRRRLRTCITPLQHPCQSGTHPMDTCSESRIQDERNVKVYMLR